MEAEIELKIGGVPEHFNLLWELDECRLFFEKEGIHVQFFEFPGGTGAMSEAVKSGFLDASVILTEGAVTEISRGCNYKIVCPFVESPLYWGIFSSTAHAVFDIQNLADRVFAISRFNSGSHLMAQYLAFQSGVQLSMKNFYPANDLSGARKALLEGHADLFLWEKYMTRPLVLSGEFRQVAEVTPPWNSFVLVMRNDIEPRGNDIHNRLCRAVSAAGEAFKAMKNAPELIVERYKIASEDANEWFANVKYYNGNRNFTGSLDETARLLKQFGISSRIPEMSELVYPLNGLDV